PPDQRAQRLPDAAPTGGLHGDGASTSKDKGSFGCPRRSRALLPLPAWSAPLRDMVGVRRPEAPRAAPLRGVAAGVGLQRRAWTLLPQRGPQPRRSVPDDLRADRLRGRRHRPAGPLRAKAGEARGALGRLRLPASGIQRVFRDERGTVLLLRGRT